MSIIPRRDSLQTNAHFAQANGSMAEMTGTHGGVLGLQHHSEDNPNIPYVPRSRPESGNLGKFREHLGNRETSGKLDTPLDIFDKMYPMSAHDIHHRIAGFSLV